MSEKIKAAKKWVPTWISLPFLGVIAFLVYTLFVHENSYMQSFKYSQTISEIKTEINENIDSARYYEKKSRELDTDPESLEKIAREQYYMKNANEDVYITNHK